MCVCLWEACARQAGAGELKRCPVPRLYGALLARQSSLAAVRQAAREAVVAFLPPLARDGQAQGPGDAAWLGAGAAVGEPGVVVATGQPAPRAPGPEQQGLSPGQVHESSAHVPYQAGCLRKRARRTHDAVQLATTYAALGAVPVEDEHENHQHVEQEEHDGK